MHGFQLWVNLPARDKMMSPRYQEIPAASLPTATSPDGLARVTVIAGEALGARAVIDTRTTILMHDWTLRAGASIEVPVPRDHSAFVYVFSGVAAVSAERTPVGEGQLASLGSGDRVLVEAPAAAQGDARLLLLGGVPIREPIAWYGPFVMNTNVEVQQAITDFREGRMGRIDRAAGDP